MALRPRCRLSLTRTALSSSERRRPPFHDLGAGLEPPRDRGATRLGQPPSMRGRYRQARPVPQAACLAARAAHAVHHAHQLRRQAPAGALYLTSSRPCHASRMSRQAHDRSPCCGSQALQLAPLAQGTFASVAAVTRLHSRNTLSREGQLTGRFQGGEHCVSSADAPNVPRQRADVVSERRARGWSDGTTAR